MTDLLNVNVAIVRILDYIPELDSEKIALMDALGRVLSVDVISEIDLPPFANSAMDGFAVRASDTENAPVDLAVVMDIPAGASPTGTIRAGEAARIMTGAPLPDGADAIVPVEDTDNTWNAEANGAPPSGSVKIMKSVRAGASVRPIGENVAAGQTILKAGTILRPQDLGMLAAIGTAYPSVKRQPRIAVITTGDELVPVDEPLTAGKIHDSNSYTLASLIRVYGGIPIVLPPANDHLDAVRRLFHDALALKSDMIVSSAGVSVGAADFVRTILEELGEINFWRINLRPGKPLAFGTLRDPQDNLHQIPFFGLPGNPVSAMVTFEVIVRPALHKMLGLSTTRTTILAICAEDTHSDGRRSYLRVKLSREGQTLVAYSTGNQSSGALMSMVEADGLMIVPEDVTFLAAGSEVEVLPLR